MKCTRTMEILAGCLVLLVLNSCATAPGGGKVSPAGTDGKYAAPDRPSQANTVETESNDVTTACESMVAKMLAHPLLARQDRAPHIIVDSEYFRNEGSSRLNKNMLTDLLRSELLKAANGRMIFVGREYEEMVTKERAQKDAGVIAPGTTPSAPRALGADYRLGGRITDLTNTDSVSGRIERYTQINFEMVDLETGQIVFSDTYKFKKGGKMDEVYL